MQTKSQESETSEIIETKQSSGNYLTEIALNLDQELLDQFENSCVDFADWDRHPWSDDWRDSHRR